jgi:hypothetical protein
MTKGLLRCGSCDSSLIRRTDPNRRAGNTYVYICSGRRQNGPDYCAQMPLSQATVDAALLAELTRTSIDLDATRERLALDKGRAGEALAQAETAALDAMNSTTPKHIATQPQVFKPLRMYVALATKKCELETAAMPQMMLRHPASTNMIAANTIQPARPGRNAPAPRA